MKSQPSHRPLKDRVTGLHIAILFSAFIWFALFKYLDIHVLASIAILIALVGVVLIEVFLAYGYKKAAQEIAKYPAEVPSSDAAALPEETNIL